MKQHTKSGRKKKTILFEQFSFEFAQKSLKEIKESWTLSSFMGSSFIEYGERVIHNIYTNDLSQFQDLVMGWLSEKYNDQKILIELELLQSLDYSTEDEIKIGSKMAILGEICEDLLDWPCGWPNTKYADRLD